MRLLLVACVLALLLIQSETGTLMAQKAKAPAAQVPTYTPDGKMNFPADYREWIYLSSGLDMNYNNNAMAMDHHMFDNVFVNPDAYRSFLETGTWPDKTMFVLETRVAESKGSINQSGHFQSTETMGREVHVKDEARFPGKWAFFPFDGDAPAPQIPTTAICYSCHREHAAVDTTFVQFYPTLIGIAKSKGTLSAAYLKDEADAAKGDAGKK